MKTEKFKNLIFVYLFTCSTWAALQHQNIHSIFFCAELHEKTFYTNLEMSHKYSNEEDLPYDGKHTTLTQKSICSKRHLSPRVMSIFFVNFIYHKFLVESFRLVFISMLCNLEKVKFEEIISIDREFVSQQWFIYSNSSEIKLCGMEWIAIRFTIQHLNVNWWLLIVFIWFFMFFMYVIIVALAENEY